MSTFLPFSSSSFLISSSSSSSVFMSPSVWFRQLNGPFGELEWFCFIFVRCSDFEGPNFASWRTPKDKEETVAHSHHHLVPVQGEASAKLEINKIKWQKWERFTSEMTHLYQLARLSYRKFLNSHSISIIRSFIYPVDQPCMINYLLKKSHFVDLHKTAYLAVI